MKIAAVIILLLITAAAMAGPSSISGVTVSGVDSTASDTANCLHLYKPFQIRIPPGTDSLVGRKLLEEFAAFIDKQVDEVYMRVRTAVCVKLAEDLTIPCALNADTLWPCTRDTLTLIYKGVVIKDTSHDDIGSAILIYEDIPDSSTTDGVAGPEYAGFMVNRDVNTGSSAENGDTNSLVQSYVLVMPGAPPSFSNDRIPGSAGYSAGTANGNSELLCDTTGNLYWVDRDWFERVMVDTIIADTMTGGGNMTMLAEVIDLKANNETRSQVGKWIGSGLNVTHLTWWEAMDNGNNTLTLRPDAQMVGTWDLVFPDSSSEWQPAIWRFLESGNEAPTWIPYDDQYIVWGFDTISCNTNRKTISIGKGGLDPTDRDPEPGQAMPYESSMHWYVEVQWVVPDADSSLNGDFIVWVSGTDKPVGCPPPGSARWDSLYVPQIAFNLDFLGVTSPKYTSDSSFVVNVPQCGCDTVWVIRWKATGQLMKWQGEG